MIKTSTRANCMLLLVSALWGASYPIVRSAVHDISSHAFVFGRFALAVVLLLPLVARDLRSWQALRLGMILGLIEGAVCAILALSIGRMPSSRCALIMGLSVVFVPIWATLLRHHRLAWMDFARAGLSMAGLYILTGARLDGLQVADLGVMAAAALWGLNIVILKDQTRKHVIKPRVLAFYQSLFNCLVPGALFLLGDQALGTFTWRAILALVYCAVFATILCLILQTRYQKHTSAAQAGLRLSLEPLFACIFSLLLLREAVTVGITVGGALMMLATVLPELTAWLDARWRTPRSLGDEGSRVPLAAARAAYRALEPTVMGPQALGARRLVRPMRLPSWRAATASASLLMLRPAQ